jgi:hypothetical protein
MDAASLKAIAEMMNMAAEFRPVVDGVKTVAKEFGPDLKEMLGAIFVSSVNMRADAILSLEARGFSREHAIIITCRTYEEISKILSNVKPGENK